MFIKKLLTYAAFEGKTEKLLRFYGKFHWEFVDYFFGIAVDNQIYGCLGGDAALVAIEQLVFADL